MAYCDHPIMKQADAMSMRSQSKKQGALAVKK
jgi:hypothetical protein